MSLVIAGQEYILPQGIAYFEKTPPLRASDVSVGNCLVCGDVGGGVPNDVEVNDLPPIYEFTNPTDAQAILKSGDGLEAIVEAFKHGASRVLFIRGQRTDGTVPAKQATKTDATDKLVFTSADYADFGNCLSVELDYDTSTVIVKLRLYNLGAQIVDALTASGASTAVSTLSDTGMAFDTKGIIAFDPATRTGDLLHVIDDGATGTKNGYYTIASFGASTIVINEVIGTLADVKSYEVVRISSVALEQSPALTNTNAAVNAWIAATGPIRQYINSVVTGSYTIVADAAEGFLYGGANGAATAADVEDALAMCVAVNAQLRTIAYSDSSFFAKLKAHILEAANAGYKSLGFVGGLYDDTPAEIEAYAVALDDDRMVVCAPAPQDYSLTSVLRVFDMWRTAAKAMGVAASLDPAEPLTHKNITAVGLNAVYTQAEREALQQAGVLFVQQTPAGKQINKGVTTLQDNDQLWTGGVNPKTPEISLRRIADSISTTIARGTGSDIVGHNARYAGAALGGYLTATLEDFKNNKGWIMDGVDAVTGENIPAYTIYRIYKVADAFYADVALNFADPINFVVFKGIIL